MPDIALTQGERYTFVKVNTVPIIVGSTDGAEDDNFYRNDLYIEKSTLRIRNEGNTILQFTSSNEGNAGNRRWIMGIDSIDGNGVNSFAIHQGSSFINNADFRVSGSTIVLDYGDMPTSAAGLQTGTVYRDASNYLRIAP